MEMLWFGVEYNKQGNIKIKLKREFLSNKIYVHCDSIKSKLGLTAENHTLGYQFQSQHFWM